jgi:FtsP/CotA-like multicopper oxidase with cupredoxin domain
MRVRTLILLSALVFGASSAFADTYNLTIAREDVHITGKPVSSITVNGSIPGPTLRFKEGEDVVVNVTNHMKESTSIHWHGMLLPGYMDGAPGFNGFLGISPGETFTYRFHVRQAGTYWYHSHSGTQEQAGNYGSIVITPKVSDGIKADRDYVVLLSDFTEEDSDKILQHLKMDSGYYNYHKRTVGDFFSDASKQGVKSAIKNNGEWAAMRMSQTDLADVSGYTFLVNGKSPEQNWTGLFKPGERVRLRFINAAAMTFFDVRIPGMKMTVVQADGQNVEPVTVDEFRMGDAETYDVIVEPKEDKPYTIVAEPIDRSGFALGTLAPREGMKGEVPTHRPRALLTMGDMANMPGMDMMAMMKDMPDMDMSSGWANAGTPEGHKALAYSDLHYAGKQKDLRKPTKDITLHLGGNMERYIWTINGKKHGEDAPITVAYGERIRFTFINESMMAHPFHLHGMFVQLENGQPMDKLPSKHTIIVPPGQSASVLLTANEPGEWPFHCHLFYHMASGMMTSLIVAKPGEAISDTPDTSSPANAGGHHHAH